ncbi:MAG: threonylcarbamoyl-AMP synthase [Nitriliruptorales bacterium]|nr:threonylcarbamoyl-AMP synthase [Nitriliruptorales bacterium]
MAEIMRADDPDVVERAAAVLGDGRLVVMPTDTVYAVVADAFQTFATQRLLDAKRRGRDFPLSLMIRNPRQVIGLAGDVPETAERLMASYWPGLVTIVLRSQPEMPWDLGHTEGCVSLRMPSDDLVLSIAAEVGPLACSAANRGGEQPPTTVAGAQQQMEDAVDLYVDGGEREPGLTTIVDCTRDTVEVLREGLVTADEVLRVAAGEVGWGQVPVLGDTEDQEL